MSELTVGDVVFALEQFQVEVDPILLHRIEWSLDWGNHEWSDVRLREELRDFVLRRSRSRYPIMSDMSLDDFLSERGISLRHYRQLIKSLNNTSHFPSFLSVIRLEDFDVDSNVLTYAQHRPERDVFLERLRDLGLSHLQCKVILGLGARSYERLRKQIQDQRKEEIGRTGRSENDAWSFAKHIISELCLRQFKEWIHHSPLVLETHQGIGDASFLYHNHGHVLGFDNHKEAHQMLMERAQISGVYREARDLYLHRSSSSLDTAHSYIFLTEEAISC
ncbi:MAG TPA: hypothetical protein VEP90_10995, partial [Methylomirabilota bacterium]|nr:hypothetical protein [Methylomirabilota bacterium]